MLSIRHAIRLIAAGLISISAAFYILPSAAADKSELVIVTWGGAILDAQRITTFEPFEKETGIKIVTDTIPSLARVKAMVEGKNGEWDVATMVPGDALVAARNGYLEPIDYSTFDRAIIDNVDPRVRTEYGIGYGFYSKVLAYSTKRYPPGTPHPESWADFFDLQRFPGPRVIDAGNAVVPPIELALMADGVSPDKLYPLDLERAYKMLTKIKPSVVKWSTTPAMPSQALIDGEADMVAVSANRIAELRADGAPIDFVWNQGLLGINYWTIIKGTKHRAEALKFIEFSLRPKILAELAKLQLLGPTNKQAYDYIAPERAKLLPSAPDNLKVQVISDSAWWSSTDSSGKSNVERNQQMWNAWVLQNK